MYVDTKVEKFYYVDQEDGEKIKKVLMEIFKEEDELGLPYIEEIIIETSKAVIYLNFLY